MDRGDAIPVPKPLTPAEQKSKNVRRVGELLNFAKKATPEEIALALLVRERRSEEHGNRSRVSKKFNIQNEDAYEHDVSDMFKVLFPTEESFLENKDFFQNVHLMRFDLKMLNYFNALAGGHESGDRYKMEATNIISGKTEEMRRWLKDTNINYNSYLVGGDEFAVTATITSEQAAVLKDKIQSELVKMPVPPDSLIRGWVDVGSANLGEVLDKFNEIESQCKGRGGLQDKRKRLWKFLDGLADRKAEMNKFIERIKYLGGLLVNLDNSALFERIYPFATKGAVQIGRNQLEALMASPNPDQAIKDWVQAILSARDENFLRRIDDPFQKMATSLYSEMTRKL